MQMQRLNIQLPKPLKAKLDALRKCTSPLNFWTVC